MTERRCQGCGKFHDKKLAECSHCGTAVYGFNKSLRTAQLNNHLYSQAAAQGAR